MRALVLASILILFCCAPLQGQGTRNENPTEVTITDLGRDPQKFDGRLVRVQGILVFGWEGDNFLSDPSPQNLPSGYPAYLWFHCKPERERQVYDPIDPSKRRRVHGSFTGYIHFVPTHKPNGMFDPGPLQFEAVGVSIPDVQPKSLAEAIREGDLEEVRRALGSGAKVNILDEYQLLPLFEAAGAGHADIVEELLASRADPKSTLPGGDTALINAAWNRNVAVAKALLEHGASVNAANVQGETPLIMALHNGSDGTMVQLLLSAGADPNAKTAHGMTPLIAAAMAGDDIAAEALLKAGADPSVRDGYGNTAESESCDRGEKGHFRVCELVREALRKK